MSKHSVHIIGGGVIGLCTAYYLSEAGWEVTVIDEGDFSDGTSYGNAGMVVPSHFVPLASPGVIWKGIKWMFNRKSPFAISTKINWPLLEWAWKFQQSSTVANVQAAAKILVDFNTYSRDLYQELAKNLNFSFQRRGLLMLYQTQKAAREEAEIAEKAETLGIQVDVIGADAIKSYDPSIEIDALGAVYYAGDAHLNPGQFMRSMQAHLAHRGVKLLPQSKVVQILSDHGAVRMLETKDGERLDVNHLVVTAGASSPSLVRLLGCKLSLQPGKGYSLTLVDPPIRPTLPAILCEAKVAITPMDTNLRIGGTMEIGDASSRINYNRVQGICESVSNYYPQIKNIDPFGEPVWSGARPCTPDGLPYLGPLPGYSNAMLATGHAMMGMSLGPASGKIISQLLMQKQPTIPSHLFRVDRFGH